MGNKTQPFTDGSTGASHNSAVPRDPANSKQGPVNPSDAGYGKGGVDADSHLAFADQQKSLGEMLSSMSSDSQKRLVV